MCKNIFFSGLSLLVVVVSFSFSYPVAARTNIEFKRLVEIREVGCPLAYPVNSIALLDAQTRMTKGWSHIVKPEKANDFVGLSRALNKYLVLPDNLQSDESCGGAVSFQATLVKKLHVWNNTHSNGIETAVPPLAIRDWDYVNILFRINAANSVVPDAKQIQERFPELAAGELASLDQGLANINLLFRRSEFEAAYLFKLSPELHFDRWLLANIPVEQLQFSKKVNYVHHHSDYEHTLDQWYETVLLKAETDSLKTVQHLNDGLAPKNSLFKEIDISIHHLLIVKRE